jgi:hypothetical protein
MPAPNIAKKIKEKVKKKSKQNMIELLKSIKRVEPKNHLSTNELIRKGRDEELF